MNPEMIAETLRRNEEREMSNQEWAAEKLRQNEEREMSNQEWAAEKLRQIAEREKMINAIVQEHQMAINQLLTEAVELQGQRKLLAEILPPDGS